MLNAPLAAEITQRHSPRSQFRTSGDFWVPAMRVQNLCFLVFDWDLDRLESFLLFGCKTGNGSPVRVNSKDLQWGDRARKNRGNRDSGGHSEYKRRDTSDTPESWGSCCQIDWGFPKSLLLWSRWSLIKDSWTTVSWSTRIPVPEFQDEFCRNDADLQFNWR